MNDCTPDALGRLLSGTCFYDPKGEYALGALVQVANDGIPSIIDQGLQMSNGLDFSPDNRTLYLADSVARRIYAYDYDLKSGGVSNRRVLVSVPQDEGLPDGLCVDSEGFIWSAQWYGSCVVRYTPDGGVERRFEVPAKQPTAIAFGGQDLTDIFVTSAGESGRLPIMPPGYDPDSGYFGGALFHTRLGIRGKKPFKCDIKIP